MTDPQIPEVPEWAPYMTNEEDDMGLFRKCADGYIGVADGRRTRLLHNVVAEMAMGRPLPKGAVVHHVDGDKRNNFACNLVVCQDQSYHRLLHRRQDALEACGHADWVKCRFCCEYDYPANMRRNESYDKRYRRLRVSHHHVECNREYQRNRRKSRNGQ